MQSLTEVKAGNECTIKWMFGNPQALDIMNQHDIREEARFMCSCRAGTV